MIHLALLLQFRSEHFMGIVLYRTTVVEIFFLFIISTSWQPLPIIRNSVIGIVLVMFIDNYFDLFIFVCTYPGSFKRAYFVMRLLTYPVSLVQGNVTAEIS